MKAYKYNWYSSVDFQLLEGTKVWIYDDAVRMCFIEADQERGYRYPVVEARAKRMYPGDLFPRLYTLD